jgi:hypothetical protein
MFTLDETQPIIFDTLNESNNLSIPTPLIMSNPTRSSGDVDGYLAHLSQTEGNLEELRNKNRTGTQRIPLVPLAWIARAASHPQV